MVRVSWSAPLLVFASLLAFVAWWESRPAAPLYATAERAAAAAPSPVAPAAITAAATTSATLVPAQPRVSRASPLDDRRSVTVSTPELVDEILRLHARLKSGDASSGYPLFALLEQCARAPAIVEELRRHRREAQAGSGTFMPDSLLNEAAFVEGECRRLPPGLLAARFEILETSAAHGDIRARLDFASYPPDYFTTPEALIRNAEKVVEFKTKAVAWLHAAADRGSPTALLKLAGLYREGVLVEPDNVAALAYYLAWDEVGGSDGGVDPYRQQREWGMSVAQLQQARDLQRQIVARCCR
jgi:hypothetical protein